LSATAFSDGNLNFEGEEHTLAAVVHAMILRP
jgi:hypothetical protein